MFPSHLPQFALVIKSAEMIFTIYVFVRKVILQRRCPLNGIVLNQGYPVAAFFRLFANTK
jgi:hypothetical protein